MERSAGLRPAAARSAEWAQEIPWVFERLNMLRLTEPRSAVAEIDLGNTPLTHAPFFLPLLPQGGEGRGEEANVYKHEPLTPASPRLDGERELFPFGACVKMHPGLTAPRIRA